MGKLKQKVMKNFGDIKNIRRFVVSKKLQRGERTRQNPLIHEHKK